MSLDFTKVNYIDGSTIIEADNLNDIQDAILALDSNKVEAESGKGLSTEDYTSAEKSKLSGIQAGAQVNPGNATTSADGLMSSVDKAKLDGIASGATAVTIDNTLAITGQAADAKATGDALAEKYEKPSGGIPDSDIASASTWNAKGTYSKPSGGIPKTDLESDVQTSLGKADTALQSVPSTYRTAAAQDVIDNGKQAKINASGMLKGNGEGGVTAATAGTDYQTPLAAGTDYETPAGAKTLGLSGAAVGDLVRVAAVDGNGKPTSWRKAPLCEIRTNQNLLGNWYFAGGGSQQGGGQFPINQRGLTIYTSAGYNIDRWSSETNITVNVKSSCIGFVGNGLNMEQPIEHGALKSIIGQQITGTVLYADGTIETGTGLWPVAPESSGYWNFDVLFSGNKLAFTVGSSIDTNNNISGRVFLQGKQATEIEIVAVKLEFGSEQTLARQENGQWVLNEIPDYGQELAKCQRYYETGIAYYGTSAADGQMYAGMPYKTTKIMQPAVIKGEVYYYYVTESRWVLLTNPQWAPMDGSPLYGASVWAYSGQPAGTLYKVLCTASTDSSDA